ESGEPIGAGRLRHKLCLDRVPRLRAAVLKRCYRMPMHHAVPDRVDERLARHEPAGFGTEGEASELRDRGLEVGHMNRLVLADALDQHGGALGPGAAI